MSMSDLSNTTSNCENTVTPNNSPEIEGDLFEVFLSGVDDINKSNEYGWSPLYRTIIASNNDATVELLRIGADPNKANSMGETPLYQAVEMENIIQVKTLLEYGANPNKAKGDGNTPLHNAIKKGNIELIKELLSNGSDPNQQNKLFKQTPLHLIVKDDSIENRYEIVKLLLEYKASLLIKDKYDQTPLEYTADEHFHEFFNNHFTLKESFDNQNNISIVSKGELYIENAMSHHSSEHLSPSIPTRSDSPKSQIQLTSENIVFNKLNQVVNDYEDEKELLSADKCDKQNSIHIERNSPESKDVSAINPIDFINQITTTNGSNVLSDQQENKSHVNRQESYHSSSIADFPDQIVTPEKYNIESLGNMSYSKSKSIIISELPLQFTSNKKKFDRSENSFTNFTIKKLKGEDKDNNSIYSIDDSNYNKNLRKKSNTKESSLNIINLAKKFDDNQTKSREPMQDNLSDFNTNLSNVHTQDLSQNVNTNNNTSTLTQYNKNASRVYSVNSTRAQTHKNNRTLKKQGVLLNSNQQSMMDEDEEERNDKKGWANQYNTEKNNVVLQDNIFQFKNNTNINNNSKKLHKWLCSIDLLCYYNKIMDKGIFDLSKFSNGMLKSQIKFSYNDIEEIGIKKPGHIFRILLKLQSDSMNFNQTVLNFLLPNQMIGDARLSQSLSEIFVIKDSCCACVIKENKMLKYLDIDGWLKIRNLYHLREHFIHNGFESIEYVFIQMFSEFQLTEDSLLKYFHIYNRKDRKILLKELLLQKKKICQILSLNFDDLEYDDSESNCESCLIF